MNQILTYWLLLHLLRVILLQTLQVPPPFHHLVTCAYLLQGLAISMSSCGVYEVASSDPGTLNLPLIIGLAVGIPLILLLLAYMTYRYLTKSKRMSLFPPVRRASACQKSESQKSVLFCDFYPGLLETSLDPPKNQFSILVIWYWD